MHSTATPVKWRNYIKGLHLRCLVTLNMLLSTQTVRMREGIDFLLLFPTWLCQRGSSVPLHAEDFRTMRAVLKYSRNCVILARFTVHTCTQLLLFSPAPSQVSACPSTKTVFPMAAKETGSKEKASCAVTPVSARIKYWSDGGPWNHHSKSESTSPCTISTSPAASAS